MNYFWPGSVNTHCWPGPVNTNLGPGPVNTNSGPGPGSPGNTNTLCQRNILWLCIHNAAIFATSSGNV